MLQITMPTRLQILGVLRLRGGAVFQVEKNAEFVADILAAAGFVEGKGEKEPTLCGFTGEQVIALAWFFNRATGRAPDDVLQVESGRISKEEQEAQLDRALVAGAHFSVNTIRKWRSEIRDATVSGGLMAKAISIAVEAHAGQCDKAGQPYILHPLRVMMRGRTEKERIVGVLHDVGEDSEDWALSRLAHEFDPEIITALQALTRGPGESYAAFIANLAAAPALARQVKVWDLEDNCDLSRLGQPSEADIDRVCSRYLPALKRLRASLA